MIIKKLNIFLFILLTCVYVVHAQELYIPCGGDNQLIIGCLGDSEYYFDNQIKTEEIILPPIPSSSGGGFIPPVSNISNITHITPPVPFSIISGYLEPEYFYLIIFILLLLILLLIYEIIKRRKKRLERSPISLALSQINPQFQ